MVVAWDSSLPPAGLVGVAGGPQSNAASFEPEVGENIDRRRTRLVTKTYNVELPPLTQTQYNAFISFFETTLVDGILPFSLTDPFTGVTANYKFIHGDMPYREEVIGGGLKRVSFQLTRLGDG